MHLYTIPRYIPGSPRRLRGAIRLHGILRKRPAAVILKFYSVRTAVFINTEGKSGKRGACVRRACGRVSGSRNASGGRVQSMVVCVYTLTVPPMRRVGRNGCLHRTAPQALRGGCLCGFSRKGVLSYFCRAADWARRGPFSPPSSSACMHSAVLYIRPLRRLRTCLRSALQTEHM